MTKEKPSHFSLRELAKELNITHSTVQGWLARGLLEGAELHEVGPVKVWRIPADAMKTFVPPKLGRIPKKDKAPTKKKRRNDYGDPNTRNVSTLCTRCSTVIDGKN